MGNITKLLFSGTAILLEYFLERYYLLLRAGPLYILFVTMAGNAISGNAIFRISTSFINCGFVCICSGDIAFVTACIFIISRAASLKVRVRFCFSSLPSRLLDFLN